MEIEHGKKARLECLLLEVESLTAKDLMGLACFCLTQSENKQAYIDRILDLP